MDSLENGLSVPLTHTVGGYMVRLAVTLALLAASDLVAQIAQVIG
jgi:hypothetical protein